MVINVISVLYDIAIYIYIAISLFFMSFFLISVIELCKPLSKLDASQG